MSWHPSNNQRKLGQSLCGLATIISGGTLLNTAENMAAKLSVEQPSQAAIALTIFGCAIILAGCGMMAIAMEE